MPNWIEGTLKVRGKAECLIKFVENAIDATCDRKDYGSDIEYDIPEMAYICNSRRAFIGKSCYCYVDSDKEENQTIALPIKQAWSFTPSEDSEERWVNLAKVYCVDIRLQGFERGMEFYQDIAIVNGEIAIDEVIEYDDWEWECPMPNLGG